MPESSDNGPVAPTEVEPQGSETSPRDISSREASERDTSAREAIPLLPRVTAPPEGSPAAEPPGRVVGEPGSPPESTVRLPSRRRSAPPVPWSLRRGSGSSARTSWLPLGTVDSGVLATVDPAGLVQVQGRDWSLDWWVRAEDRWHHPSMEPAVEQSAAGGTAVVRTAVRVPGGAVVHRCFGAQVHAGPWSGSAAAVQVTNESAVPVALALVVRPYRLDAPGSVSSVEMSGDGAPGPSDDATGHQGVMVRVNGAETLFFDHRPARVAHGTPGEVSRALATGSDEKLEGTADRLSGRRWDSNGDDLEVAFVFPLAHTATVGVSVTPATQPQSGLRQLWRVSAARVSEPSLPVRAPAVESVQSGWQLHAREDPALTWVVDAASGFLEWSASMLRVAGADAVTAALDPSDQQGSRAVPSQLDIVGRALGSLPAAELHLAVAAALVRAQRFSGRVDPGRDQDATIALMWVAAALLRGPDRSRHAEELVGPVAKALAWLDGVGVARAASSGGESARTAAPAALRQVAVGLSALGQPELATRALAVAASVGESGGVDAERRGLTGDQVPRSPFGDPAVELAAAVTSAVPGVRQFDAPSEASARRQAPGFDLVELAELRNDLLWAVVADTGEGAALFGLWNDEWNGRQVELHRVPTAWGLVSAALRWHGARPALLWEIHPWFGDPDGAGAPVVTAPGLRADWSATGWNGEALLD